VQVAVEAGENLEVRTCYRGRWIHYGTAIETLLLFALLDSAQQSSLLCIVYAEHRLPAPGSTTFPEWRDSKHPALERKVIQHQDGAGACTDV
jgi:hypothetical protein